MKVYVYRAGLLCSSCGEAKCEDLDREGVRDTGDSDLYPQGPYPNGGGEADSPQTCDAMDRCRDPLYVGGRKVGAFLENPLTPDGEDYLCEMVTAPRSSKFQRALHKVWLKFYGYSVADCKKRLR